MSDITGLVTGLAQGLNAYMGKKIDTDAQGALNQQQSTLDLQNKLALKNADNQQAPDSPDSQITPDMAEKILPGGGASMVQSFQKQNGRFPTIDEGIKTLKAAQDALQPPDTSKADNHQDTLEKNAMDRMTQVRGDTSIQRTEVQRDASGQAYDTIAKAEAEGRPLTQLEQTDLIGQLWKARSGSSPTDQDMKQMQDATGKRDFNHFVTYVTGDPSVVGASTKQTLDNIKQFVVSTGHKADQQHEGYMAPRLIKPTGLEDSRWQNISKTARGISFGDQMAISDKTHKNPGNSSPKVGDVVKGYTYMGGDKADPASWKKAAQ